jgi:formate dehydrogenase subunit beta
MNVNHILHIRDNNAVDTLRSFLSAWWVHVELDAMIAPIELPDHGGVSPQVIEHPDELSKVNPFLPVMLANSAPMVDGFIKDHPGSRLAVILRPCELRALVELQKRNRVQFPTPVKSDNHKSLVTIGVDCPGTFSPAEYARHVEQHLDDAEMIKVALAYGSQESYIPYQARAACQMCDSPSPLGADMIIGTIGIAPQGSLLVIARDENIDVNLKLQEVTEDMATEQQVVCREVMVGKLTDKRTQKRTELIRAQAWQTEDINTAWAMIARCTLCADCLDACPLYDGELSGVLGVGEACQSSHPLLSELVSVSRWLASCSGCGMCQEVCEHGVSLMPIIITLSHRIQHGLKYRSGDPNQRLPWIV